MSETQPPPPSVVRRRGRPPKVKPEPPFADVLQSVLDEASSGAEIKPLPAIEDVARALQGPPVTQYGAISICDVVQVTSPTSPHYGTLFIVGDIRSAMVHGFHMASAGKKEFITVGIDECTHIGISKTRSKEPVSPQWKLDHKIP